MYPVSKDNKVPSVPIPLMLLSATGNRDVDKRQPLIREQKDLLKHLDAILIPVGGYYTIDAAQAKTVVDDLAPRIVIPMHYRSDHFGYPVIGRLEEFTGLCRNVVEYDSNTLVLLSLIHIWLSLPNRTPPP